MDWQILLSFALVAAIFVISPGPNFLLLTRSVPTVGKSVALATIPGFSVALLMHGALSIFGVSAIISAQPTFLLGMQIIGSSYLFYLGAQSILAVAYSQSGGHGAHTRRSFTKRSRSWGGGTIPCRLVPHKRYRAQYLPIKSIDIVLENHTKLAPRAIDYGRCFLEGFLTNILNPKTILFYLAAFPQFITGGTESTKSSFTLVLIHVAISAAWFFLVAQVLDIMLGKTQNSRVISLLNGISGYALIGLSFAFLSGAAHAV